MANLSSQLILNGQSNPVALNSANAGATGNLFNTAQHVAVTTGEVSTNVLRLVQVPSNARVCQVLAYSTALGGTAAGDIGVYRNARDVGAVIDADFFGSAVSFVSASSADVTGESGIFTPILRSQPLWQALGLAADPRTTFDIAVTLTANVAAGGSLGVGVSFVQ